MIPTKIVISGIGPFRLHTEIVIPRGLVAFVAPKGTGKTFLIECPFAALYGRFIWYPGSPRRFLSQNGDGEALLEVHFDHDGDKYVIRREFKETPKTLNHKAWVFDPAAPDPPLAGPNVADVERWVLSTIGSPETALATWMMAQPHTGDLCGQPGEPSLEKRRREVFKDLLDVGAIDDMDEKVAELQKADKNEIAILEARLGSLPGFAEDMAHAEERLGLFEARQAESRMAIGTAKATVDAATLDLAQLEASESAHRQTVERFKAAKRTTIKMDFERSTVLEELAKCEERAAGIVKARADEARLEELRASRDTLEVTFRRYEEWRLWDAEHKRLKARVEAANAKLEGLEAASGVTDETRALAGRYDALRDEYRNAEATNRTLEEANQERAKDRAGYQEEITSLTTEHATLSQRQADCPTLPEDADPAVCATCPHQIDYQGLEDEIKRVAGYLKSAKANLAEIPTDEPIEDLTDLIREGQRAAEAKKQVEAAAEAEKQTNIARSDVTNAVTAAMDHFGDEPDHPEDPTDELNKVRREIESLDGAGDRVQACLIAIEQVEEHKERAQRIEREIAQARAEESDLAEEAKRAEGILAEGDESRDARHKARREAQVRLEEEAGRLDAAIEGVARNKQRIAHINKQEEEANALRADLDFAQANLAAVTDLRDCFGPHGVRQLLIDGAAPELEEIANDLFNQATGGQMGLRISTRRQLQSGETAEAFSIMVRHAEGNEREVERHSGGELHLISILLRIAVAIWVGQKRDHTPETLIADETFDRLGSEGTDELWPVLERLSERFESLWLVTHDPAIAARAPHVIRLTKSILGTKVAEGIA